MGIYAKQARCSNNLWRIKMLHPNFVIFYVDNPTVSAAFYADLLTLQPVESAPTFVSFCLNTGLMLGLRSKHADELAVQGSSGGAELGIKATDEDHLYTLHADWKKRGLVIIQPPIAAHWGLSFVAVDPDNYRLRVFIPAEALKKDTEHHV
jgi:hypothetical protein